MSSVGDEEEQQLASPAPVVGAADVDLEPQRSDSPAPQVDDNDLKGGGEEDEDDVAAMNAIEPAQQVDPVTIEAGKADELSPLRMLSPAEASVLSISNLKQKMHESQKYELPQNQQSLLQFSSKAAVIKGGVEKNLLRKILPLCYDERDFLSYGEVLRYVYVHGNIIFVYTDTECGGNVNQTTTTEERPLYAIPLDSDRILVEIEDPKHPDPYSYTISPRPNTNQTGEHFRTVLLKDKRNKGNNKKILFQFTFDVSSDPSLVKSFVDVLEYNWNHYSGIIQEAVVVSSTAKAAPSAPSSSKQDKQQMTK